MQWNAFFVVKTFRTFLMSIFPGLEYVLWMFFSLDMHSRDGDDDPKRRSLHATYSATRTAGIPSFCVRVRECSSSPVQSHPARITDVPDVLLAFNTCESQNCKHREDASVVWLSPVLATSLTCPDADRFH